jgi:septal ring factor EnvC (AmiA/AmiB activator)
MKFRMRASHTARVLVASCALALFAQAEGAPQEDNLDLESLEFKLEQLKRKEHSLQRTLERGQTDAEKLRRRVVARGRAYYRLSKRPPSDDFFEHAVRVERVRQGLLRDLRRIEEIKKEASGTDRRLTLLRERRAPLEIERSAAGRARDALLSRAERERAFQMAFSSSAGSADHTAVYSPGTQLDLLGSTFASMMGKLPFPLPGRAEVERVKLPYADGPGLFLKGAIGTPARAVYGGRVAYADDYAEYGKTVILDHGDDYFTVTAGLESIDVKVGDDLPQSARLGLSGTSGGVGQIYFEIRRKEETLSPGEWLGI